MASPRVFGRRAATSAVIAAVAGGVIVASRSSGPASDRSDPAGTPGRAGSTAGSGADPPPAGGTSSPSDPSPSATSATSTTSTTSTATPSPTPAVLPRGGRSIFPTHRLVGYSGGPGSAAFGRLGVGDIDQRVREIEQLAVTYAAGREPLPVLELIAVVAQPRPGADGRYRVRIGADVVRAYLDAARRHRALLLLNVQPGRARFIDEVRALESWLVEPDVGLALDPEWAVRPGQVPGRVFGRTTGAELDEVAAYLAMLVEAHDLPEKALVVHQLRPDIVAGLGALRVHPGVVAIKSVDGIGPPKAKTSTWTRLVTGLPAGLHPGFKLFFGEDAEGASRLMTPAEVLALRPTPEYVLYE